MGRMKVSTVHLSWEGTRRELRAQMIALIPTAPDDETLLRLAAVALDCHRHHAYRWSASTAPQEFHTEIPPDSPSSRLHSLSPIGNTIFKH
ncbi:hypothetical protein CPELA_08065 [Corynebacterium pelargi]|uniref:Uncharacterized protein n=1 Tax=Corynebacterium pelargi TaxID=1471400 RepID=A0A410WAA3_9CORY|nr:hypothetical protein CPELA_08065 [Corynebacterium pelargi]